MIGFIHKIVIGIVKRKFKKNTTKNNKKLSEEVKILEVNISHSISEFFFYCNWCFLCGFWFKGVFIT